MHELKSRLLYLSTGEFASAVIFTLLYIYHFSANHRYSLIFVLFVLNIFLLQGSFYWFVHWIRLKRKQTYYPNLFKWFSSFKKVIIVLLSIAPPFIIVDVLLFKSTSMPVLLLVIFVYVFALLEYINYFHVQLTNYKNGRGKKSSIAKGLQKWGRRPS